MNIIELNLDHFEAIIFDLNGTMINDGLYHREAFKKFFEKYNLEVSKDDYERNVHAHRSSEIFPALFNTNLSKENIKKFTDEKESLYRNLYTPHIQEVPGLSEFINNARSKGLKLAVASSSPSENITFALESLHLTEVFQSVISGYEVENPKPHPEIYLRTMQILDTTPDRCLIFEDSIPGIKAACAAKVKVIGLLTENTDQELRKAGATITINNYTEIDVL